jgi:hypothetical protein
MKYGVENAVSFRVVCWWALFAVIFLGGCRTQKDVQRGETTNRVYERNEQIKDVTRLEVRGVETSERSGFEINKSYIRVTEFDTTGAIRSISEAWGDRQRSDMATEERTARAVSMNEKEQDVAERDSSSTIINETVHSKADSRPIQGSEWGWVIITGAVILVSCILIIAKRRKRFKL